MRVVQFDPGCVAVAAWQPDDWTGFLELHVEQASALESSGTEIGLVSVVSGAARFEFTVFGRSTTVAARLWTCAPTR